MITQITRGGPFVRYKIGSGIVGNIFKRIKRGPQEKDSYALEEGHILVLRRPKLYRSP